MNLEQLKQSINKVWDESIVEQLTAYVRIPNKSPLFDPQWESHGYMEAAIELMANWCRAQPIPGMQVDVKRLPGKTPLLLVDIPGELPGSVLLYGHLDNNRNSPAGCRDWVPGSRRSATASCMGAAPPTTAMRYSAP